MGRSRDGAALFAFVCYGDPMTNPKKIRPLPPIALLRERLSYDPLTGELRWRSHKWLPSLVGRIAGHVRGTGYQFVTIHQIGYMAHRIAWAIHYGEDPGLAEVDHIDGNRSNNRIANLRLVSQDQNAQNRGAYRNNQSGYPGVRWKAARGKYVARVVVNRVDHHVGYFTDPAAAFAAREAFARRLRGDLHRT